MMPALDQCRAVLIPDDELCGLDGDITAVLGQEGVRVIDRLDQQLAEIATLVPAVGAEIVDEPPLWAYYPWRRTVVRTLGPIGFRRLRLDRNRNKITASEQADLLSRTIAIVGLSVGHSIGFAIAQEGLCGHVVLADFDDLDVSNLNRVPSTVLDVGLNKSTILARRIAELDPYMTITVVPSGATANNIEHLVTAADLIVDECDSIDIKCKLRFVARNAGIPVIMHTSDGGILDVERFDHDQARPIFHGMVDVANISDLEGLTNAEKVPIILSILDIKNVSARMGASLLEMDDQVTTWPQLASDVTLGAGMVGAAVRRWGLGQALPSGRLRIDVDGGLASMTEPELSEGLSFIEPREPEASDNFTYRLLDAARHAPSGGNSQPWRFAVDERSFAVHIRPERTTGIDIAQRGSLLAIGAALFNAEVTAAAHARLGPIELPEGNATHEQLSGTRPVAILHLGAQIDPELADLASEVRRRATCRTGGIAAPIDHRWLEQAADTARVSGSRLVVLQGAAKNEAGELWAAADRIRLLDERHHREMMSELRWAGDDLTTGIDTRTLGLGSADLSILGIARRTDVIHELGSWSGGARLGNASRDLIQDADAMLVLTAPSASDAAFVAAGRTVQRLWLHASAAGVGLHPMSPLFLYALAQSDLTDIVDERNAEALWSLRSRFAGLCGFEPDQPLALVVRATTAPAGFIRSVREPVPDHLGRTLP